MPTEDDTLIDMHHKIRKGVRRRLKLASVDLERPVTDIVNQAISAWLEKYETQSDSEPVTNAMLRSAIRDGQYFDILSGISKEKVIRLLEQTGDFPDGRWALDLLVLRLRERLMASGSR
jgi:hypothetical protein